MKKNESAIIQKLIQIGQMLERGELEQSGAEMDVKHYLDIHAANNRRENIMKIEFMCGLLANYSKELSEAKTYREKGEVQLKHAKLILDKVKNCSMPDIVERSEQLKAFLSAIIKEFDSGGVSWETRDSVENFLKSL